jgi:hypothetical protein
VPLGGLRSAVLNNRDAIRRFLSLTGGSILYCLSALSIVYGITQIIGPPLAKSGVLADILPCVGVLNVYELALLAVLVLIVVWRNVTDDAISLVILVGLFLVASGMTLGIVAPSGLNVCLAIGFASVALGLAKLYVLRRYIALRIGALSAIGLALVLAWNFLGPSLMARPIMARTATDELRRSEWLLGWVALLIGAAIAFVDAVRKEYPGRGHSGTRPPFLHTHSMALVFVLVLLTAAGAGQYGIAYMFAVDYLPGDFYPLAGVMTLLAIEFMRGLGKWCEPLAVAIACMPLILVTSAVPSKMTVAPPGISIELISYPPVLFGLTGVALVWMSIRHRWRWSYYMAIAYALGVLLTLGRDHQLNLPLFGAGLITVLLVFGIVRRSPSLCFLAILVLATGLETMDTFAGFAEAHHLSTLGAAAGVVGLGGIAIALAFGRRTPAVLVFIGTIAAIICVFDYLPKSLQWVDLAVFAAIGTVFAGLLLRIKDVAPALILWIPIFPRAYLFATRMSSWNFVVLSFLLLFLGAVVSLFLK